MRSFPRDLRGLTIIELIVVFAIIGILAAIVIPTYTYFLKKAKQVEAKVALRDIANLEASFIAMKDRYSYDLNELGVNSAELKYYTDITITPKPGVAGPNYLATAKGNIDSDPDLDIWTIDENRNLVQLAAD